MKNIFVSILIAFLALTGFNAYTQIVGPDLMVTDPHRGTNINYPITPASLAIAGPQDFLGYDFNALFTFTYAIPDDYIVPIAGDHDLIIAFNNTPYMEYMMSGPNLVQLAHDPRVTVSIIPGNAIRIRLTNGAFFQELSDFTVSFRVHIKQTGNGLTAIQYSVSGGLGGNSSNQFSSSFNIGVTPLPITLGNFKATKVSDYKAHLEWNTFKEENSKGFIVERSADGKQWGTIGFVPSQAVHGNSTTELNYSLYDENPLEGKNLYRLKMVDLDESYMYSAIRTLEFSRPLDINLYPNPAQDYVTVTSQQPVSIYVYDLSGKVVFHQPISDALSSKISTAALTNSNYKVVVITATGVQKHFSLSVVH